VTGSNEEKLEMFKLFISDSRELLDEIEPQIITMEEIAISDGKVDEGILNAIFRLFHSLKGSSSFLDLPTITSVTHEAETLLDIFRKGQVVINSAHVDLLIRTIDFIRNILDTVESQLNDHGHEDDAAAIKNDLQKTIASMNQGQKTSSCADSGTNDTNETFLDADGPQDPLIFPGEPAEDELLISPEMTRQYIEESTKLLDEAEKALLALERTPDNLEYAGQAFRAFHNFKGNTGFFGYAELEEVSRHAEMVLDLIKSEEKAYDTVMSSFLLIAVDSLRDGIRQVGNGITPELPGKNELIVYLNNFTKGPEENQQENVGEQELDSLMEPEPPVKQQIKETASQAEATPTVTKTTPKKQRREKTENEKGQGNQLSNRQQQAIRVDLEKLDILLDLVGELVISEAMVANNPDLKGLQLDRFEKAVLQLDKITRDIQEVAMSMRMIPLSGTFRKMVRLVRDLAQKANKKVSLDIIGEETEVDKTIIEQISDPLVHLIRNAVDHGIEGPEERKALSKPETGRVTIEAKHSAGEVWIVVEDDGKGLDREKILRKGLERGLIKGEDRELKDEEVWQLIFEPGFSTAEKISSISGRGVGMDVVKRNIEKLRGKVDVRSKPGTGTMFVMRIPLTLAIIEGMVVKIGRHRYIIPINSIKETLQPGIDQITRTPDKREIVRIRSEFLPVIRLHELYKVQPACTNLTNGILIVVESSERRCCLFVDEVVGQQQIVIKGLSGYLGHVKSISGCAILSDGDISMILDVNDLINTVETKSA